MPSRAALHSEREARIKLLGTMCQILICELIAQRIPEFVSLSTILEPTNPAGA
ncbi:hypothetical protein CES85_0769 [Ochrobactrum quorumnocens]|uniref:Uncharacterized protein n=1 Tax=Ochrobactrum quorumnocens TaxID=271865 RepID=A0A248UMR9_9HYPH|nr:hypothetical protein CES85_0769 [[Ochrobactrum] quorumnocens]